MIEVQHGSGSLEAEKQNKLMESLQSNAMKIMNNALKKANKSLESFGFTMTIELKFHEISAKTKE